MRGEEQFIRLSDRYIGPRVFSSHPSRAVLPTNTSYAAPNSYETPRVRVLSPTPVSYVYLYYIDPG